MVYRDCLRKDSMCAVALLGRMRSTYSASGNSNVPRRLIPSRFVVAIRRRCMCTVFHTIRVFVSSDRLDDTAVCDSGCLASSVGILPVWMARTPKVLPIGRGCSRPGPDPRGAWYRRPVFSAYLQGGCHMGLCGRPARQQSGGLQQGSRSVRLELQHGGSKHSLTPKTMPRRRRYSAGSTQQSHWRHRPRRFSASANDPHRREK